MMRMMMMKLNGYRLLIDEKSREYSSSITHRLSILIDYITSMIIDFHRLLVLLMNYAGFL